MRDKKGLTLTFPFEGGPYGTPTLVYDALREATPVARVLVPSGLEVWLVTRYRDVSAVHRDTTFSREEALRVGAALAKDTGIELEPGVIQNTDGERHSRLLRVFSGHYSPRNNSRWAAVIRNEAHAVIDSLKIKRTFDLRADYFEPVAQRAAEKIFGFQNTCGADTLETFFDKRMMNCLRDQLVSRFRNENELCQGSYLKTLHAASVLGLISEPDLVANLLVFFTVTFHAVRAPFLGGMLALLRDTDQWKLCQVRRSLVSNAVDEMLRCFANGDGQLLRVTTRRAILSGVEMSPGSVVLAPVSAANVDPEIFRDPRRFDICRPNLRRHLGLGIGRHHCLGSYLARVWMGTALLALLDRFPTLRLAASPDAITFRPMSTISVMDMLPVTY
jgi:cytochrome P450